MSALFDRENPSSRHPRDDDTTHIPAPDIPAPDLSYDPHDPDLTYDPADADHGRLRPTIRARRIQTVLLLGAYTPACLGSAWLAILAYLRLNSLVMVMMTAAAIWLGRDAVRLARWLTGLDQAAQPPRPSRLQRVVASVLAATYIWLLIDWLLHQ